jgi:hypothetical protein
VGISKAQYQKIADKKEPIWLCSKCHSPDRFAKLVHEHSVREAGRQKQQVRRTSLLLCLKHVNVEGRASRKTQGKGIQQKEVLYENALHLIMSTQTRGGHSSVEERSHADQGAHGEPQDAECRT